MRDTVPKEWEGWGNLAAHAKQVVTGRLAKRQVAHRVPTAEAAHVVDGRSAACQLVMSEDEGRVAALGTQLAGSTRATGTIAIEKPRSSARVASDRS